ncbi:MAG: RNB domain-containing ribonuclease [Candidatus Eisenbacteria bacterium]|nr:RNB domain-containing ribonuclease [Candidatus Eisenbacteria bacterium]
MSPQELSHRARLRAIARRAMLERGFFPDFSDSAQREVQQLERERPVASNGDGERDLRHLLWASIDNDDSRDLDQLTVAAETSDGDTTILVAVANVDRLVRKDSAVDDHAERNTTSVYTPAVIFPMLPEALSTDMTSLNENEDRSAIVVEMVVDGAGVVRDAEIYPALVRNHAKLAYDSVGAWLAGTAPPPDRLTGLPDLAANLRIQDEVAGRLRESRHEHGALDLETVQTRSIFHGQDIRDLSIEMRNAAKDLIEDFMIAANGATARFLMRKGVPSIRRVVRSPDRWGRIVDLAREHGEWLPSEPDAARLEEFLMSRKAADPLGFPDLSLAVIKLLGRGEYVVESPGEAAEGHFGLAVQDYTHSTAPNRRFPDLLTQRLLKSALAGSPQPYAEGPLAALARHCTTKENDAEKVERALRKSAAALVLEKRIGDTFEGIVTGAAAKGTWVRIFHPPVEGKVVAGVKGLDVGDRVHVRLVSTDVENGFIDFERVR